MTCAAAAQASHRKLPDRRVDRSRPEALRQQLLQVETKPELLPLATLIHVVVRGKVDGLDELAAGELAGSPGGDVVRIAGDPEGVEPVLFRERQDELQGARGVVMPPVLFVDSIADLPAVFDEEVRGAEPEL